MSSCFNTFNKFKKEKPYLVSVNQEYRLSDGNEDRVTPTISIRELKSRYPRFVDSIHIASWEMQYPEHPTTFKILTWVSRSPILLTLAEDIETHFIEMRFVTDFMSISKQQLAAYHSQYFLIRRLVRLAQRPSTPDLDDRSLMSVFYEAIPFVRFVVKKDRRFLPLPRRGYKILRLYFSKRNFIPTKEQLQILKSHDYGDAF